MSPTAPSLTWRDRAWTAWRRRNWRGFARAWSLFRGDRHPLLVRTPRGAVFALDPFAYIDRFVIEAGFYESEVLEAVLAHLRPGAVLWDIGANFGLHAVSAACLMPQATVVAFEPNPIEHARLLQHRAWNAPHLIVSSLALSDAAGVLPLHLGPVRNSGMTTLGAWAAPTAQGVVLVSVAAGDDLIARGAVPAPTVIKLDVEGHEAEVLNGLRQSLAHPRCECVVFEDGTADDTPAKQTLRAAGFTVSPLSRHEATSHPLQNFAARKPGAVRS